MIYHNGLNFECQKCGNCCSGIPGYVYLTMDEIKNIARYLGIKSDDFIKKYTLKVIINGEPRLSLIEKQNFDCIFYSNDKGCEIYPVRPYQCRSFPFWPANLENYEAWIKVSRLCPGVNRGRYYSAEEIREILLKQPDYNMNHFK